MHAYDLIYLKSEFACQLRSLYHLEEISIVIFFEFLKFCKKRKITQAGDTQCGIKKAEEKGKKIYSLDFL